MAARRRSVVPRGPTIVSGASRRLSYCASRSRNGSPPKWSPCRWLSTTASRRFGSSPRRRRPTSAVAPKSSARLTAPLSTRKQALQRPPEPKASPQPTTVRRMAASPVRPGRAARERPQRAVEFRGQALARPGNAAVGMAARVAGLQPRDARDRALRAGDAVAGGSRPLEPPAEDAGPRAAGVVVANGVVADLPAAVDDDLAVVVPEDAPIRSVVFAEHDAARVVARQRVAAHLRLELRAGQRLGRGWAGERRQAERDQDAPSGQGQPHARALGRPETSPCQRRTCVRSSGKTIRAGFMK